MFWLRVFTAAISILILQVVFCCKGERKRYLNTSSEVIQNQETYPTGLTGVNLKKKFFSKRREQFVQEAFIKADRDGNGVIDADDLKGIYDAKGHPKYVSGEWDERRVFEEYLKSFEPDKTKRDGKVVTPEQFMNYYARVSASVDEDVFFELMVKSAWHF